MSWNIVYYKKRLGDYPVKEFIDKLGDPKTQQKIMSYIAFLKQKGHLPFPYTGNIEGVPKLRELRIRYVSNIYRIFYFLFTGRRLVLLHGFVKKGQKTPKKEIEIAKEDGIVKSHFCEK